MASRRKNAPSKWQLALQFVAVLLLTALLVGILAAEFSRTADALQYEEASPKSVPLSFDAAGYLFYDAHLVESIDRGPIDYRVSDGASVAQGETLAVVYADGAGAGTRERAKEIALEIERLQALDNTTAPPDYHAAYTALMQNISQGRTQGTPDEIAALSDALALFAAQTESAEARAAEIAALRAEFEELIKNDRDASDTVTAAAPGIFRRATDGFEENMKVAAVDDLTVAGLAAMLASPQSTDALIGSIVSFHAWRLVLPVTVSQAACFTVGVTYEISFTAVGDVRMMTLVRVSAPDAEGNCLLVLAGEGLPPANFERRQPVSLVYGERSGLWVPMSALTEADGGYGVYVYAEGRAAWRTVVPVCLENGYCLAAIDAGEGSLQVGERILVTKRRVYEGKVL